MKRLFPWLLLALSLIGLSVPTARAAALGTSLSASREREIAGWLPTSPTGFAWPVTNRVAWEKLAADPAFGDVVADAANLLDQPLPAQPDDLFLEYSRDGNRTHWQNVANQRRGRIAKFVLAEAMENRGRFLPALEKTIAALCAEKTWVMPAHDGNLLNFRGRQTVPDLGATSLAAELAEADYVLGDKLSPATRRLLRGNVERRVLNPFRDMITGRQPEAFWVRAPMNWNAVCVGNTVFAALALLPSRADRAFYAAAGERCIRYYLSGFTPDGYCAEGLGYWNYGFGHFILLTEALRQATGGRIDLFRDESAVAPALFCRRSEVLPGIYPTIADCAPGTQPSASLTAYVCQRFGLAPAEANWDRAPHDLCSGLLFAALPEPLPVARPLKSFAADPLRSYFPYGGVLISRAAAAVRPPFAAVLKGGNNDEPHNHNDVGSFSVIVGTNMVICDPGGEVYTRRTFSAHRYDSEVLNSFGHAVPVVAGQLQRTGANARGVILATNFSPAQDRITFDFRSAYAVPQLEKLERTFVFQRQPQSALEVTDEVKFSQPETFETALITWGNLKQLDARTLELTDGDSAVRVSIDTGGRSFQIKSTTINEDVHTPRKPVHVGIVLDQKTTAATVRLRIVPEPK
jgi:hypothetical protein